MGMRNSQYGFEVDVDKRPKSLDVEKFGHKMHHHQRSLVRTKCKLDGNVATASMNCRTAFKLREK